MDAPSAPKTTLAAWLLAAGGFVFVYGGVFARLVHDWAYDDNYSHGFVILPFAIYFAWERRHRFLNAAGRPTAGGLLVVLAGLAMLVVGRLGVELFLMRTSAIVVITGTVAFLAGWQAVRVMVFPLAFLLLMIPVPAIIFNQIALPLQFMASSVGETVLSLVRIPVLREGNLIVLARTTLEVAEACSGIRSLISLLTLGIIYVYFFDRRTAIRALVALATVPIAILANGIRVAGTGIAAQYLGDRAAHGFLHAFSGWLMFLVAFGMVFVVAHLLQRLASPISNATPAEPVG